MRMTLLLAVVAIAVGSGVGRAEAKLVKPMKMTCAEFLVLGETVKPAAVAYLDGYSKAGKLKEEDIGEVDVDREVAALVVTCKEDPKKTLLDRFLSHVPGGKKLIKPTKMTCEDFVALDASERPEAVYWAEGYNKAKKVGEDEIGEVDLERDVAVVYEECKQAPKESLWAKIKKHV